MQSTFKYESSLRVVRRWMIFFMISLFISGLTAIPVETELQFLSRFFSPDSGLGWWLDYVYVGVKITNEQFPFIGYGYDWHAFAHFVLGILFIGPYKDPVKNKWVIQFGILACIAVIPFALIAGQFRGIPIYWRLIDCSFGLVGLATLLPVYHKVIDIEKIEEYLNDVRSKELSEPKPDHKLH